MPLFDENELQAALARVGRGPCVRCAWRHKCLEEELACRDFSMWINKGAWQPRGAKGQFLPSRPYRRVPQKHIYERIFTVEDEE